MNGLTNLKRSCRRRSVGRGFPLRMRPNGRKLSGLDSENALKTITKLEQLQQRVKSKDEAIHKQKLLVENELKWLEKSSNNTDELTAAVGGLRELDVPPVESVDLEAAGETLKTFLLSNVKPKIDELIEEICDLKRVFVIAKKESIALREEKQQADKEFATAKESFDSERNAWGVQKRVF